MNAAPTLAPATIAHRPGIRPGRAALPALRPMHHIGCAPESEPDTLARALLGFHGGRLDRDARMAVMILADSLRAHA